MRAHRGPACCHHSCPLSLLGHLSCWGKAWSEALRRRPVAAPALLGRWPRWGAVRRMGTSTRRQGVAVDAGELQKAREWLQPPLLWAPLPRREATISARSAEPAARCATAFALLPLRSPHSTRLPPSTRRDAEATTRPDQVSRGVTGAFQLPSCDAYGAMPCGKTACRGGPPSFGSTDDQSSSCTMSDLPEASTAPQPCHETHCEAGIRSVVCVRSCS